MAAVDFLSKQDNVDAERIGIIGICGWGGIALNAAAADTRIKATVASTMYDMTRVSGNGYFDSENKEESRHAAREAMAKQRLADPTAMAGSWRGFEIPDSAVADFKSATTSALGVYRSAAKVRPNWLSNVTFWWFTFSLSGNVLSH